MFVSLRDLIVSKLTTWRFVCVFSCVREISKSDSQLCHVCLSVRMEQLGSHWTDFHEI
jgi:hypothetical protein